MARRPKTEPSPKKQLVQSSIFQSLFFNKDIAKRQRELVDLSDDSDIEIVREDYDELVKSECKDDAIQEIIPSDCSREVSQSNEIILVDAPQEEVASEVKIDDDIACPICGLLIHLLTLSERVLHVDDCFNFGIAGDTSFQVTTQTGYVYKSMKQVVETNKRPVEDDEEDQSDTVQKKVKREKNPIPDVKIMDFKNANNDIVTKISMDAFCYRKHDDINHYFLSHFHSDHYMGITKSWHNGQIYCSLITKRLLIMKFKVDEEIITHIDFNEPTIVPGTQVKVTLFDANHCPGSAIFLFENLLNGEKILHCGDFRVDDHMILNKLLFGTEIAKCYLDTTYLNPTYSFPKQRHVISVVSEFCCKLVKGDYNGRKIQQRVTSFFENTIRHQKKKQRYLICVGTYTIGKERIAIDIAMKLGVKLYANFSKREILSTFNWDKLDELITEDPYETPVHLVPMMYLNNEDLERYFQPYKTHFQNIIAFKPTGWTFIKNDSIKWMQKLTKREILLKICQDTNNDLRFNLNKIESQFKSDKVIQIYAVPYSEHSSFRDLSFFCTVLNFQRIIPTVNLHNLDTIREMDSWIKEWSLIKQENLLNMDLF